MDLVHLMTSGLSKDIRRHVWPYSSKRYVAERKGEGEREIEGRRVRWVDLGCLMTRGLSKDIRCHV